jgi:hypothetical protein
MSRKRPPRPKSLEEMFAMRSRIMRICVLNENKEVVALTDGEWFRWMLEHGDPKQRVAESIIGPVRVSTMFLGSEVSSLHLFDKDPTPMTFETMIFTKDKNIVAGRYATWDEAVKGHAAVIASLNANNN